MSTKSSIGAIGLLSGGIIGAGIFSLPYVVHQSGLLIGLGLLGLSVFAYYIVHLMYADMIVGTPGQHRFVGYVRMYLGVMPSWLAVLMAVVEMVLVLTIYLILAISFFRLLGVQINPEYAMLVFWAISSVSIFINQRKFAGLEMFAAVAMIAIIGLVFLFGLPHIGTLQTVPMINDGNPLLPLSAILFALSGRVAIPSLIEYLRYGRATVSNAAIKKSILVGTLIPGVVCAVFIAAILSLAPTVSSEAVTGIIGFVPQWLLGAVGVLGLLSLWSSYMLVGLDISNTAIYDLDLPSWLRICIVVVLPVTLIFAGFTDFTELVSFVGGIFLVFEGLFILLAWSVARQRGRVGGLVSVSIPTYILLWLIFSCALIGLLIS